MIRLSLLLALVACHEPPAPQVTAPPPPGFGIAFERILPTPARDQQPQFEATTVRVGSTCWRGGQRLADCPAGDETNLVSGREQSPSGAGRLHIENDNELVIESANEEARIEQVRRACWTDEQHVAWIDNGELIEFDLRKRAKRHVAKIAGSIAACDPGGGRAAIVTDQGVTLVELATREPLANVTVHADSVAVAGRELAIFGDQTLVVLHQIATTYVPVLLRRTAQPFVQLAFSRDGSQLAIVGKTLVMFERGAAPRRGPDLPMAAAQPGFVTGTISEVWDYAQLPAPSGWAPLPIELVRAHQFAREVVTVAIDPATVSATLATTDDAAIRAYALQVMPELFEQWAHAKIGTGNDAEFTLRTGRREGKPFFETRELWSDGCEPYDGYTQVVIERDLLFVTRVLVAPGDTTNPWLQPFFDLPFQSRAKIARRPGIDPGPC